jgi:hypothetical protein
MRFNNDSRREVRGKTINKEKKEKRSCRKE